MEARACHGRRCPRTTTPRHRPRRRGPGHHRPPRDPVRGPPRGRARRLLAAAADPDAGPEALARLAAHGGRLRRLALLHPRCPSERLALALADPSAELRAIAAAHPATPHAAALALADDPDPRVRARVEHRRACLRHLALFAAPDPAPAALAAVHTWLLGQVEWTRDPWLRAIGRALASAPRAPAGAREGLVEALAGRADERAPIAVRVHLHGWERIREAHDREDRREAEYDYAERVRGAFAGALDLAFTGDRVDAHLADPSAALGAIQALAGGLGWGLRASFGAAAPGRGSASSRPADLADLLARHAGRGRLLLDRRSAALFAPLVDLEDTLPLHVHGWAEALPCMIVRVGPA